MITNASIPLAFGKPKFGEFKKFCYPNREFRNVTEKFKCYTACFFGPQLLARGIKILNFLSFLSFLGLKRKFFNACIVNSSKRI